MCHLPESAWSWEEGQELQTLVSVTTSEGHCKTAKPSVIHKEQSFYFGQPRREKVFDNYSQSFKVFRDSIVKCDLAILWNGCHGTDEVKKSINAMEEMRPHLMKLFPCCVEIGVCFEAHLIVWINKARRQPQMNKSVCVRACVRACVRVCVCQRKMKDRADGVREKSAHCPRRDSNLYLWDTRPSCFRLHHDGRHASRQSKQTLQTLTRQLDRETIMHVCVCTRLCMCAHVCARARMCVRMRACVYACVHARRPPQHCPTIWLRV